MIARHRDELEAERSTTLTVEQYKQLQGYRHDLRDWPESAHFPELEYRPEQPAWLAEQLNNARTDGAFSSATCNTTNPGLAYAGLSCFWSSTMSNAGGFFTASR